MDRKAWKDANPAIGEFRSLTDVEDFANQAARLPAKEASFRWLYLNQRVEGTSPLLNRSEWMANSEVPDFDASSICYAGLDLSASRDLTAFVRVFKTDGIYHVVPKFFLPAAGLREKSKLEKVPYDTWADQGFLTLIDGPVIIPEVIAREVAEADEEHSITMLAYDRWRINDFKRELDGIGAQVQMASFGQGFKDMAPAVDKLERLVAERKLRHGSNPIMNMCAANAIATRDPAGNRKLDKSKASGKIDGLVALAMALGVESQDDEAMAVSPWDDPAFTLAS